MIVVISNRQINAGKKDHKLFGEELASNAAFTRMAIADYEMIEEEDDFGWNDDEPSNQELLGPRYDWHLEEIAKEDEEDKWAEIVAGVKNEGITREWVFFVHGNNQTTIKNLEKCRKLKQTHGVNVISFSWPSWSKVISKKLLYKLLPLIAKGTLTPQAAIASIGAATFKKKKEQYKKARENAKSSATALESTINILNANFIEPLSIDSNITLNINMLIHSLGNRVIKSVVENNGLEINDNLFENIILHQADVDSSEHNVWVDQISLGARLFITINKKDSVLRLSDIFGENPKRLGNGIKDTASDNVDAYIDFSNGDNVGLSHGLFLFTDEKNEKINDCFTDLFCGENLFSNKTGGRIPLGFNAKSENYFKMA